MEGNNKTKKTKIHQIRCPNEKHNSSQCHKYCVIQEYFVLYKLKVMKINDKFTISITIEIEIKHILQKINKNIDFNEYFISGKFLHYGSHCAVSLSTHTECIHAHYSGTL